MTIERTVAPVRPARDRHSTTLSVGDRVYLVTDRLPHGIEKRLYGEYRGRALGAWDEWVVVLLDAGVRIRALAIDLVRVAA
jgi:hypothetical protein